MSTGSVQGTEWDAGRCRPQSSPTAVPWILGWANHIVLFPGTIEAKDSQLSQIRLHHSASGRHDAISFRVDTQTSPSGLLYDVNKRKPFRTNRPHLSVRYTAAATHSRCSIGVDWRQKVRCHIAKTGNKLSTTGNLVTCQDSKNYRACEIVKKLWQCDQHAAVWTILGSVTNMQQCEQYLAVWPTCSSGNKT